MNKQEIERGIECLKMQRDNLGTVVSHEVCDLAIYALQQQLTEQPKAPCYSQTDCEMKENGNCLLDGPCPHLNKPITIGDKIRESNESLSGFIRGQFGDDRVFHDGKSVDLDDFLNQPTTNTP